MRKLLSFTIVMAMLSSAGAELVASIDITRNGTSGPFIVAEGSVQDFEYVWSGRSARSDQRFASGSNFTLFFPTGDPNNFETQGDAFQTGLVNSPTQSHIETFYAINEGTFRAGMQGRYRLYDISNPTGVIEDSQFTRISDAFIEVINLNPLIQNESSILDVTVGQNSLLSFDVFDPGILDNLVLDLDLDDNGVVEASIVDSTESGARTSTSRIQIPYFAQEAGMRTLRATLTDDGGGSVTRVFTINAVTTIPEPSVAFPLILAGTIASCSRRKRRTKLA